MLPSIEQKLMTNTSFKQLVLSAMATCLKTSLDDLTVKKNKPTTEAEKKLLKYSREKMKNGSILNHNASLLMASDTHVVGILAMFDDSESDDIVYTIDAQGALVIDWDQSKPILITKITDSGYLNGLAGCEADDYTTEL